MAALGLSPADIAAAELSPAEQRFEVWEENWEIVAVFLRMRTQWNVTMAGPMGLNYSSLEWICRLYEVADPVRIFEGIQIMECAALSQMNSQNGK